jgi:hypothetical protein
MLEGPVQQRKLDGGKDKHYLPVADLLGRIDQV